MARQNINLGTAPGGLDGDDARTAFSKTNANFVELYGGTIMQPASAKLTAIASSVWTANQLMYMTGAGTVSMTGFTAFARTLLDDADALTMRTTLGALGGGDFGLGSSTAPLLGNFAASNPSGIYHAFTSGHASATPGGPAGLPGGAMSVLSMGGLNSSYQAALAVQNGNTPAYSRVFIGSRSSATALYWNELVRSVDVGTAAAATLTTSTLDGTPGRVLKVGDFGLGYRNVQLAAGAADTDLFNGFYDMSSGFSWPSRPNFAEQGWTRFINLRHNAGPMYQGQIAMNFGLEPRIGIRNNFNSQWGTWRELYSNGNVVGTVVNNAGTPAGAIIEHGANANGRYTKFADGTLIQWGHVALADNVAIGTANTGGGYRSAELQITFPVGFAPRNAAQDQPICTDVYIQNNSAGVRAHPAQDSGIFGGSYVLETKGSSTTVTAGLYIRWKAVGRWY